MKIRSLIALGLLVGLCGCTKTDINLGNWKTKADGDRYVLLTEKDAKKIGEMTRPPSPYGRGDWDKVKDVGEMPEKIKPALTPYAITVVDHSFAFLEVSPSPNKNSSFDDVEWGWKVTLENKSKYDEIYAYGGYALFDKDGFLLVKTGMDWDNWDDEEYGVLIKAGSRVVIKGSDHWRVNRASKPYSPTRVASGDYRLFLRHGNVEYEARVGSEPPSAE